jgi:peptidylprolyl isomerase
VYRGFRRAPVLLVLLVAGSVALGGCSSSSPHPAASKSPSKTGQAGVTVIGGFGVTPKVTIPAGAAPTALTQRTLVAGSGATVAAGDILVANYVGETWASKPDVFDSSFSRGEPAGFVIGEGQVIPGWDKTLVGKRIGSRVLLTIPPADAYGASGNSQAGISGTDTLVFVVDLIEIFKPGASAPGTADSHLPATGWPKVTSTPTKPPKVTSVKGVKAPKAPISKLLIKGLGAAINSSKTLVLELVQIDIATGKQTQSSWTQAPQVVSAAGVLEAADALKGQAVGARAIALLPASAAVAATATSAAEPASPAEILVIDVVGQF